MCKNRLGWVMLIFMTIVVSEEFFVKVASFVRCRDSQQVVVNYYANGVDETSVNYNPIVHWNVRTKTFTTVQCDKESSSK